MKQDPGNMIQRKKEMSKYRQNKEWTRIYKTKIKVNKNHENCKIYYIGLRPFGKYYQRLETQDEDGETRSNLHLYC